MSAATAQQLATAGIQAWHGGRLAEACALFERATAAQPDAAPLWAILGQARFRHGDAAAAEQAAERALALNPGELRAVIVRGDCRAASDDRAASSFYALAVQLAARVPQLPPDLAAEMVRVTQVLATLERRYRASIEQSLRAGGIDPATVSPRFRHSLDLMSSDRTIYFQEPTSFFFPGLPQIQFYERADFPWLFEIEAATPAIQSELRAILAEASDGFTPYVEKREGRPVPCNPLLDDPKWGALHIWKGGVLTPDVAARCPATVAALAKAPIPVIRGRSPMALFSRLKPGTHIVPHNGLLNTRLICHLPLVAPSGCRLRVGNDVREWQEGRALIFDDSIEHEAWNDGAADRVVLLFEIWRPELSAAEREALTVLFEGVSAYGGVLGEDAG